MEIGYKFDPVKHVHTLDGKPLHGVTSVLKNWGDPGALINWAAGCAVDAMVAGESAEEAKKAHLKKRDKAGDKGTEIHKYLEDSLNLWIEDGQPGLNEIEVVQQVLNWMVDNNIKPLKSEMQVYSRSLWYGGIADGVIEKDGKKYILDFKTSGSIQTKAFYQCGAYSYAVREMVAFDANRYPEGVVIVHIPKGKSFDPKKNVYWRYDIGQLENAFVNILETYKIDQGVQKQIKY